MTMTLLMSTGQLFVDYLSVWVGLMCSHEQMEAKQLCQEATCSAQDSLSGVCEGEMSYLEHLAKVIAV